jgi:hypothetical protein
MLPVVSCNGKKDFSSYSNEDTCLGISEMFYDPLRLSAHLLVTHVSLLGASKDQL